MDVGTRDLVCISMCPLVERVPRKMIRNSKLLFQRRLALLRVGAAAAGAAASAVVGIVAVGVVIVIVVDAVVVMSARGRGIVVIAN